MKAFAEDPTIHQRFKEVALQRPLGAGDSATQYDMGEFTMLHTAYNYIAEAVSDISTCTGPPKLQLSKCDPEDYCADELFKLLPIILNPSGEQIIKNLNTHSLFITGKRGFYRSQNKPVWFPEGITFKSPNHPKGIETYFLCWLLICFGYPSLLEYK